jgi:transposase InsO family protein
MRRERNERVERAHARRLLAVRTLEAAPDRQGTKQALAEVHEVDERSVRRWAQKHRNGTLRATPPGPAPRTVDRATRQGVIALLVALGPFASVATIRALFATVPFSRIRSMKQRMKRVLDRRRGRGERRLTWYRPGRTWAMDFTHAKGRLAGKDRCLLVVRDLASGYRLAAVPCRGERTHAVIETLRALFSLFGAPLVIKHDNGPAFRAEATQDFLERNRVLSLASPIYRPQYNGSIERSLGWTKVRIEHLAASKGHAGAWRREDVERAREQANATLRPWGPRGPTPHAAFEGRGAISPREREAFQRTVRKRFQDELLTHKDELGRLITDTPFEVMRRKAIMRALIQHRYLKIRRGRISKPISSAAPDRIS